MQLHKYRYSFINIFIYCSLSKANFLVADDTVFIDSKDLMINLLTKSPNICQDWPFWKLILRVYLLTNIKQNNVTNFQRENWPPCNSVRNLKRWVSNTIIYRQKWAINEPPIGPSEWILKYRNMQTTLSQPKRGSCYV